MSVALDRRNLVGAAASPDAIPALTGLRGVAAWWVVVYHFRSYFPDDAYHIFGRVMADGYLAVDLFFALSGFILALNYMQTFRRIDSRGVWRFLTLRFARIYPLYIFMLLIFLLNPLALWFASTSGSVGARYDPGYFILSVLMMQNWGFTRELAWNIPAWSISTEWFAYLVFPALAWLVARTATTGMRSAVAAASMLMLLGIGLIAMQETLGSDIARNGLLRCLCEFTAGMYLYQLWRQVASSNLRAAVASICFAICVALYVVLDVPDFVFVPVSFLFLIYALACREGYLARLFAHPALVRLGLWSYATYMVHYFVKDWVTFILVNRSIPPQVPMVAYVAAVFVASIVLYRYLEVPGRQAIRALLVRSAPLAGRSL